MAMGGVDVRQELCAAKVKLCPERLRRIGDERSEDDTNWCGRRRVWNQFLLA